MSGMRRLLDGPLALAERRALEAGLKIAPSAAQKRRVWGAVDAGVAGVGADVLARATNATAKLSATTPSAGGLSAAGSSSTVSLAKLLLTWSLVGSGVGLGVKLLVPDASFPAHDGAPAPALRLPAALPTAVEASSAARPEPSVLPDERPQERSFQVRAPARPTPLPAGALNSAASRPRRQLSEAADRATQPSVNATASEQESALVNQARSELRRGLYGSCLSRLQEADRRFPRGILLQERSVLRIQVLRKVGQTGYARVLEEEFARSYPDSPHLSKLRELSR